jgi:hypothetical protein
VAYLCLVRFFDAFFFTSHSRLSCSQAEAKPIAPNRSEPDYKPKNLGKLQCYRTVTLRGVLTFEHHRKLEPPPEVSYSTYVLRTPGVYTVTYKINAWQTYFHTGIGDFHVEAPHHLSLISCRGQHVEISGRLIPESKFHHPTLVVDKISRLHD